MQTIWGDPDRFVDTYFRRYNRDPDSKDWRDWALLDGRRGDAGERRLLPHRGQGGRRHQRRRTQAGHQGAGVGSAHRRGGGGGRRRARVRRAEGPGAEIYVSLKPGYDAASGVEDDVKNAIRQIIGPIARPAHVWVSNDLPKTRSGKIMRRVIAAISNFMDVGDTTTLANPEIVEEMRRPSRAPRSRPERSGRAPGVGAGRAQTLWRGAVAGTPPHPPSVRRQASGSRRSHGLARRAKGEEARAYEYQAIGPVILVYALRQLGGDTHASDTQLGCAAHARGPRLPLNTAARILPGIRTYMGMTAPSLDSENGSGPSLREPLEGPSSSPVSGDRRARSWAFRWSVPLFLGIIASISWRAAISAWVVPACRNRSSASRYCEGTLVGMRLHTR